MEFNRTLEQVFALERKIRDVASDPETPAKTRWMDVHWNRMKLYELVIEASASSQHCRGEIILLNRIADRVRLLTNTRDPDHEHFTSRFI